MRHPLIQLEHVSKSYGIDENTYRSKALDDVSLTVDEQDFMIVFGASGSGKSTLLNIIAGLEEPSEGKVLVRGRDLARYEAHSVSRLHRLRVGMVFQSFNLLKSLNCWENVALPMAADGVRYTTRKKKALKLMEEFGLAQYAKRRPSELSGGEQQRLAIARALVNNPPLFLIDEPTGNLDSKTAAEVMDIFAAIHQKRGVAIVMVTHNPAHVSYGNRVASMQDGRIIQIKEKKPKKQEAA